MSMMLKTGLKLFETLSEGKPHVRPLVSSAAARANPRPIARGPSRLPFLARDSRADPCEVSAPSAGQSSITDWVDILTGDNYALDELDGVAELVEAVCVLFSAASALVLLV
jgi:hypothetical protein